MLNTNYCCRFRARDCTFLEWQNVEDPLRGYLMSNFGIATAHQYDSMYDNTSIVQGKLSFYPPSFHLSSMVVVFSIPTIEQDQFFFADENGNFGASDQLDGTNVPIYRRNQGLGLLLTSSTVLDYVRFFFHFVHATTGSFRIVEAPEDIPWKLGAGRAIKDDVNSLLLPLTFRGMSSKGLFHTAGTIIFRDALIKTDIFTASRALDNIAVNSEDWSSSFLLGQSAVEIDKILMEDLPIIVPR